TDTFVILKDRSHWRPDILQSDVEAEVSRSLKESVPGLCFSISQPIEQRMNEMIAGSKGDVAVRIIGPDLGELRRLGAKVAEVLSFVEGTSDLKLEQTAGLPVVTARLDNTALAGYGVSGQDALDAISAAQDGKVVGTIFEGKPRFDLTVRFAPDVMRRGDDLASLPVFMSGDDLVPLGQLARMVRSEGAAQISHRQGDRFYTVQLNVRQRDLGGYVEEAQRRVSKLALPPGYRIEWGGQFENMRAAQERLMILVPLALLLIFALLYALFESVRPGLLVFLNVPLAFSGGIFALLLRGFPLSVTAGVGFIALFGVAVMNGVVLISTIRHMEQSQGIMPRQAALLSARQRLRPVLMTAMVASFGFVPMAFADSVGAEVQRPLATVVIGGLITSTLLTLLVLPAVYSGFSRHKRSTKQQAPKVRLDVQ
ncbi:MAG: efflux RND transporter permease subunit, partial [Cyanobacteria bacterium]|nr:efflux RND transporter permease subunit [Cyanobacteriota bacterium]